MHLIIIRLKSSYCQRWRHFWCCLYVCFCRAVFHWIQSETKTVWRKALCIMEE